MSSYFLGRFPDARVFQVYTLMSGSFNLLFYCMPAGFGQYLCFFFNVFGIAGQFVTVNILAELRVPPENFGAAMVIMWTVGTMISSICPILSTIGHPFTMIYPSVLAAFAFCLSYLLA